jgi:hypothetical protein
MVPAAVTWFREAGLIGDSTAINTTLLLDVGKNRSFSDLLLWQLMWFRLANLSPLVKWYVCNTELDTGYPMRRIEEKLAQFVGSASVRKGALQSLCQLIKSSPLSEGDNPLVETVLKGRTVEKLTRYSRSVDQMVILYGAYVMAEKSGCSVFTIRQMMTTEFEGDVVSPMSVFGISPEEFKKQCMGLAAVHPDYIACSFTLGLDEVRVFPETKNRDDVITLILENN